MQAGMARAIWKRLMVGAPADRGYLFEGIKAFAGPPAADSGDHGIARQAEGRTRGLKRSQRRDGACKCAGARLLKKTGP